MAAQTDAAGLFLPSPAVQVSKYPIAYDSNSGNVIQVQYNYLNFPLFGGGVVPFLGDYLEVVPRNPFRPPLCLDTACTKTTGWQFNTYDGESPLTQGIWTDNRDVLQSPAIGQVKWDKYGAPGTAACIPGQSFSWTRNQNLYTSLLGAGLVMQAEGNARRTDDLEKRAYVVQMQNLVAPARQIGAQTPDPTTLKKRFKLTFGPNSGQASFNFATDFTNLLPDAFNTEFGRYPVPVQTTIYVDLPYASGGARSVFVRKNEARPVEVIGEEVKAFDGNVEIPLASCAAGLCPVVTGGLKSRTIVAPDPSAPVQTLEEESHDALFGVLPVLVAGSATPVNSFTYTAPTISDETLFGNSLFSNNLLNPTWTSPTWTSPTWTSPTWTSPTWTSPDVDQPDVDEPDVDESDVDQSDVDQSDMDQSDVDEQRPQRDRGELRGRGYRNRDVGLRPPVDRAIASRERDHAAGRQQGRDRPWHRHLRPEDAGDAAAGCQRDVPGRCR